MRGVVVFMTAIFLLGPYYVIGTYLIEPLAEIAESAPLAPFNGANAVATAVDSYFIYAPAVWCIAWFIWMVRYYASPETFISSRQADRGGGRRP